MRIDGTNNVDPFGLSEGHPAAGKPRSGVYLPVRPADYDAQLQQAIAPYQSALKATGDFNQQAVDEARRLLASGELDTPQAAERAAENMLNFGL